MDEPGLVLAHRDVLDRLVGQERGVAVLGAIARRGEGRTALGGAGKFRLGAKDLFLAGRNVVALGLEIGEPRQLVVIHPDHRRHAGQQPLVACQPGIARRMDPRIGADVGVAEQHRVVAGLAGLERDVAVPRVERHAIGDRAVVVQVQPGIEAGAARRTGRRLRVVPPKQHAVARQAVQVRGLEAAVAERRKAVAPPLVRGDEKDVARHRHGACGSFSGHSADLHELGESALPARHFLG